MKVKDLNAALLSAGAIKRRPTDIVMRVEATISTAYASLTSSISEFNVTTFSSDPDLLYVIGDYTDFTTNNAEVLYSPGWNGEYEGYVYLPKLDQGIKLVEELDRKLNGEHRLHSLRVQALLCRQEERYCSGSLHRVPIKRKYSMDRDFIKW